MNRLDFRPVASTALAAALLAYVGCSGDPAVKTDSAAKPKGAASPESTQAAAKAGETASPIDKLFAKLNNPAAVLLVSGQQDGYLEPCGCSAEQFGGLLRRFDLIDKLRKQNWPVALVDLGSLIKD